MLRIIHIGLLCVQEDASDRATMSTVVLMLSSNSTTLYMQSVRIHPQLSTQFLHLMTSLCLSLNQDKETVPSVCSCAWMNYFEE